MRGFLMLPESRNVASVQSHNVNTGEPVAPGTTLCSQIGNTLFLIGWESFRCGHWRDTGKNQEIRIRSSTFGLDMLKQKRRSGKLQTTSKKISTGSDRWKNVKVYKAALARVAALWDAEPNTKKGDELSVLAVLVENYVGEKFKILPPDPIEAIKFRMEQSTEILNRKWGLSIRMMTSLDEKLNIPAESLLSETQLIKESKVARVYIGSKTN